MWAGCVCVEDIGFQALQPVRAKSFLVVWNLDTYYGYQNGPVTETPPSLDSRTAFKHDGTSS